MKNSPGHIRYGRLQVRLLACLAVAAVVIVLWEAGILTPLEQAARELLVAGSGSGIWGLPRLAEAAAIAGMCLAPAILRIEQPLAMIALGTGFAFVYFLVLSVVLLTQELLLPIIPVLLGLFGSASSLETMAWSEERNRRRELESLEQAKQRFTDMLVHDLNKRMTSILISLSLLAKNTRNAQLSADLLATIRTSAERMQLLTGNLLDIRKIERGTLLLHRTAVSLRGLVRDSLNEHRVAADLIGVQLEAVGTEDVAVNVDRALFARVMANLLWNALQHAPAESTLTVCYEHTGDGAASIAVANRGAPIPADEKDRVFGDFVRGTADLTAGTGTGLGLAFCKLAVEAHGGDIGIDSPRPDTGDGVRVRLRLPLPR